MKLGVDACPAQRAVQLAARVLGVDGCNSRGLQLLMTLTLQPLMCGSAALSTMMPSPLVLATSQFWNVPPPES